MISSVAEESVRVNTSIEACALLDRDGRIRSCEQGLKVKDHMRELAVEADQNLVLNQAWKALCFSSSKNMNAIPASMTSTIMTLVMELHPTTTSIICS